MKKFLVTVCMVLTACGVAQAQKTPKVGTVDVEQILGKYQKAIDLQRVLSSDLEGAKQRLTAEGTRLQAMKADVERAQADTQNPMLNDQGRASARTTLETKAREFQDAVNKFNQNQRQTEASIRARGEQNNRNIIDELRPVVATLAKERSVDLVIPSGFTLFADPALDLTEEVLSRLNKSYALTPLAAPAPAPAPAAAPAATTPAPAPAATPAPAPAPAAAPAPAPAAKP
ncbi:MAG: OmpH family outer membrane protein [Puniceicoccales bacterium]|jgi:Skp family chaperone for outer membrane proteins|nr:OmpH family outer membrane protein [Puniceicoccales bacterium]